MIRKVRAARRTGGILRCAVALLASVLTRSPSSAVQRRLAAVAAVVETKRMEGGRGIRGADDSHENWDMVTIEDDIEINEDEYGVDRTTDESADFNEVDDANESFEPGAVVASTTKDHFNYVHDMNHLKAVSRRLRGSQFKESVDSADMLADMRRVCKALLHTLLFVQGHYQDGDKEGAVATLKHSIGNLETFVKEGKEDGIKGSSTFLKSLSLDDATSYSSKDIPNSQLAEFLKPQLFEEVIPIIQDAASVLDNLDLSLFTSKDDKDASYDGHFDFGSASERQGPPASPAQESFPFEFRYEEPNLHHQPGRHSTRQSFDHTSFRTSILRQHRDVSDTTKGLGKINSFFQNDQAVMARHDLRTGALGTCQPECKQTDVQCNCRKLFGCVNAMDEYDLAVMVSGGFIDTTPTSDNYANFTISLDELSLFDAEEIRGRLVAVKTDADDHTDITKCNAVIGRLYSGCNPSKTKCSNPNTESFQVSTKQVCQNVKTKTKLLFEVIGDEFDGMVDKSVAAKERPLSYDVCKEFVATFDSLYEQRDDTVYELPNPMRQSATEALHDKTTTTIFQRTQFPLRFWFNKNSQTGVVDRSFQGVNGDRWFTILNKKNGKAIEITKSSGDCAEHQILMRAHNPSNVKQQFKLYGDGKSLVSRPCQNQNYQLALDVGTSTSSCFDGAVLKLKPSSGNTDQQFKVKKDGSIVSVKCPNLALSVVDDGTIREVGDPSLVPFTFVNPKSQRVITTDPFDTNTGHLDGRLKLQDYDESLPPEPAQGQASTQYFFAQSSGSHFEIVSPCDLRDIQDGDPEAGFALVTGCNDSAVSSYKDTQQWNIHRDGTIESASCLSKVIGFQGDGNAGTILVPQNRQKADPNQQFLAVTFAALFRPSVGNPTQLWDFHFVNPPIDFAVLPGFPGDVDGQHLSSAGDKELAKSACHACDRSMTLLLGSDMSLGTLKGIVADITVNGSDRMPGKCCFDTPTTDEARFGIEFDPTVMECQNRGLWHLGLSDEACANAGGKWHRSPCSALKSCIDARPKRFDPQSPLDGTCQDSLKPFVASENGRPDFLFANTTLGCAEFCQSLPESKHQVGMIVDDGRCVCLYNDGKIPDKLPAYATKSPPRFSFISDGKAIGLSHRNIDCTANDIAIEVQDYLENSPRQLFHLSYDGQIVSAKCPQRVLSAFSNGSLKAVAPYYHLEQVEKAQQQWIYNEVSGSISNVKYPTLMISSMKNNKSTLESYFFSLENYGTGLTLGIAGDSCANGQRIVLQKESSSSLSQKFRLGDNGKIISVMCPAYLVSVSDCTEGTSLKLESLQSTSSSESRWQFDNDGKIGNIGCSEKFIGIGRSSAGAEFSVVRRSNFGSPPPHFNADATATNGTYINTEYNTRQDPGIGSGIVLSNSTMQQKNIVWTKRHQRFTDLLGPYYFVNSGNNVVLSIGDTGCAHGMALEASEYNPNSQSQQFYLGNHGSIFSAVCGGGVVSLEGGCGDQGLLKLNIYNKDDTSMKWDYMSHGFLRGVKCNEASNMIENVVCKAPKKLLASRVRITWAGDADNIIDLNEVKVIDWEDNNLAFNKPIKQKPVARTDSHFIGSNAVDGDTSTRSLSPSYDGNGTYWEVNLGDSEVSVKEVVIDPGFSTRLNNSQVSILDEDGTLVASYSVRSDPRPPRYVKVWLPHSSEGRFLSLAEVQVFAVVDGVETNIALNGIASESSIYPNQMYTADNADKAIDGIYDGVPWTEITHTEKETDPWWMVDLGADAGTITKVVLWNRQDSNQDRLSNASVTILDSANNTLSEMSIGDSTGQKEFRLIPHYDYLRTNVRYADFLASSTGAVTSRKVRIDWLGENRVISLKEVLVSDFGGNNKASGKTATWGPEDADSSNSIDPSQLVDDNSETFTHGVGTSNPWLEIDLAEDVAVKEVVIDPYDPGTSSRLSNAKVTLFDKDGDVVDSYRIFDVAPETSVTLSCGNYVMGLNADDNGIQLQPQLRSLEPQRLKRWRRENTRLLSEEHAFSFGLSDQGMRFHWNQQWSIHAVDKDYDGCGIVSKMLSRNPTDSVVNCFGPNPAFSSTFEDFAQEVLINDPSEESQCGHARQQLTFDADYAFDVEVCEAFNQKMCAIEFTGVDHAMESLSDPTQFEQVEYQEAEYEKAEYKEDAFDMPPEYSADPVLVQEDITSKLKDWVPAVDEESSRGSNPSKASLNQLQDAWLEFELIKTAAERAHMLLTDNEVCKVVPETIPLGWMAVPNPAFIVCCIAYLIEMATVGSVLTMAEITAEILYIKFEKETEGPDGDVYANDASRMTYHNLKNLDGFLKDALHKTNNNIKNQHTDMRKHLQDRHWTLETNIRREVIETGNAIGGAIEAKISAIESKVETMNMEMKNNVKEVNDKVEEMMKMMSQMMSKME